ncbi:hypothetical protein K402DRAFT_393073 [Aulographum hederae CBS 113979]|uniref:Abscisic acid G-protein coupled receptor-like domain-containing protein n=1 Tax=Aulographum hederae CBS 113979 TaxID=1176131 RepID=A0A6G1H2S4_9PEZI|nr:hypothetical protein K402DRAFT_393073 [Aulographum hederae CBS 113979]
MQQHKLFAVLFASLPFVLTFAIVSVAVLRKLFPLLAGEPSSGPDAADQQLPLHNYSLQKPNKGQLRRPSAKHLAGLTFSTNIALSTVLVELILCEIINALNPEARSLAIKITLPTLLFLLILVAPALGLHSIITAAGWNFTGGGRGRWRAAWMFEGMGLALWLFAFWWIGKGLLGLYLHEESYLRTHTLSEGCLERIGVIGVSLMACLAGFAAVSSLWQTFGAKSRQVSESDISRKTAGLAATDGMLLAKQSRLRALQRKITSSTSPTTQNPGFMTRVMGSLRPNAHIQEARSLSLEISGLETMRSTLSTQLLSLQSLHTTQQRSHTAVGRCLNVSSFGFSIYCLYRIGATSVTALRRFTSHPGTNIGSGDPVTHLLSLLAKHWDPTLDRAAWSRQISFLLSGFMLLASFNQALQTFLLLARTFPSGTSILRHVNGHANLALLVGQVVATYVISSALLLRSNLPADVRGGIGEALGVPLDVGFVERWFEGWFLLAVGATAVGVWVGGWVKGKEWEDDGIEDGTDGLEMGKMN